MEIRDNGAHNPLIIISSEEVATWLRERADAAGYSDRAISAIQLSVEQPFGNGRTSHYEVPTLTVMVSNIRNSRIANEQLEAHKPPASDANAI